MEKHIVQPGECFAMIAKHYGYRDWKLLYNAPENDELRQHRPNPNILHAGDEIVIPERQKKQFSGAHEKRHRFKACAAKWVLRLRLVDHAGQPLKDTPYRILIEGEPGERKDKTDGDGMLVQPLAADAHAAVLHIFGDEVELVLGDLDPIERVTGVQQRLGNLGFDAGPADGIVGPRTRAALLAFQKTFPGDLTASASIDDATRRKLAEVHDGSTDCHEPEESMAGQDMAEDASESGATPGPGGVEHPLLAGEEELTCRTPASRLYFALYYYDDEGSFRRAAETWWAEIQARADFKPEISEVIMQEVVTEAELKDSFVRLQDEAKRRQATYIEGRIFSHASVYVFGVSDWKNETKFGLEFKKSDSEDGTVTNTDIAGLARLPWDPSGLFVLHGCNSGYPQPDGSVAAQVFARTQGVRTIGQRGWAVFSESPTTYQKISPTSPKVYLLPFSKIGRNLLRDPGVSGDVIPPFDTGPATSPQPAP